MPPARACVKNPGGSTVCVRHGAARAAGTSGAEARDPR